MSSSGWSWTPSSSGSPQTMHRPGQSGRHSGRDRLGQRDRLADRRLEVQLVVVGQPQRVGLVVGRRAGRRSRGRATAGTPRRSPGRAGSTGRPQAAAALDRERGRQVARRRGCRGSSAVRRTWPAIGRREDEVLGQVDAARRRRRRSRVGTRRRRRAARRRSRRAARRAGGRSWPERLGRVLCPRPPTSGPRPSAGRASSSTTIWRAPLVEHRDPLLDALERLDDVALEADQHADRVLVRAAPDLVGVAVGLGDDLAGSAPRRPAVRPRSSMRNAACSWALRDDPLGLVLGLLDDPLALGVDPLGRADLLGDGDPQLVDEPEGRVLVDDDVGRQRQLLAVRDERLEALDEEDDVDRSALLARRSGPGTRGRQYGTRTRASAPPPAPRSRAVAAAAGSIVETSPPKRRDLLDQARADVAVGDRGHEEDGVDLRARGRRLLWASCISVSKSLMARRPRTMAPAPLARPKSTVSPSNEATSIRPAAAPSRARWRRGCTAIRVSTGSSGVLRGLASTPTMTRSKTAAARRR